MTTNPTRLLVVLLLAFVVLSGLNYLYYYETTKMYAAQAREAVIGPVSNPLAAITKSENSLVQARRELSHVVIHEVVLAALAIVGVVLLARRR